jgi:energy-converting hydrogenase Eha subunit H
VRLHVSGVDLIRDEQGHFRILEDNIRIPSGAWLLAFGYASVHAMVENDFGRLRLPALAYFLIGLAQFGALLRYHDQIAWSRASAWRYVAMLASVTLIDGYGLIKARTMSRAGVTDAARQPGPARP